MDQELLHLNVLSQDTDVRNSDMHTEWLLHSFMFRVVYMCLL
jgi:hypothetical protein